MKTKLVTLMMAPLLLFAVISTAAAEDGLPVPKSVQIAQGLSKADADRVLKAGLTFMAFWNTGDEKYARAVVPENYIDRNLPKGRPPGLKGVLAASKAFRKAVPDLKCSVEEVYVLKDRIIGRLLFTGTFTGEYGKHKGKGQKVAFQATDIYHVNAEGIIVDAWHLEDYLTLFRQMEVVADK